MKLVTFLYHGLERIGAVLEDGRIVDFHRASPRLMVDMVGLIRRQDELMPIVRQVVAQAPGAALLQPAQVMLLAPIPRPTAMRDGYAFRQHVATARRNRGMEMIPEFDQFPVTYFTNHLAVVAGGELALHEQHFRRFDYELEVAVVVGRPLKNATLEQAGASILGHPGMHD